LYTIGDEGEVEVRSKIGGLGGSRVSMEASDARKQVWSQKKKKGYLPLPSDGKSAKKDGKREREENWLSKHVVRENAGSPAWGLLYW